MKKLCIQILLAACSGQTVKTPSIITANHNMTNQQYRRPLNHYYKTVTGQINNIENQLILTSTNLETKVQNFDADFDAMPTVI
jgi:hypothetical protein